jgi:hypothetical protein
MIACPIIKNCYHEPSLQNVLDTHTNKLFEQASNYYTEKIRQTYFQGRCTDNN